MTLPVLVINRDQDTVRLLQFSQSADRFGISFERIAALDAHAPDFPFHDHAHLIGSHFWGKPEIKPGAVGCFLSHRKAWQHMVDMALPMAMICEDDAIFRRAPVVLASAFAGIEEFDILFANERLASWSAATCGSALASLTDVVTGLAAKGGPKALGLKAAPGGDCYVLSRQGAERLLARTADQRIVCGVDWAMVWNSLADVPDQLQAGFPELSILKRFLPPEPEPLRAFVLVPSIADQSGSIGSTIRHAVTCPIVDLVGGGSGGFAERKGS